MKNRNYYFDVLRIFAIIMVMLNHSPCFRYCLDGGGSSNLLLYIISLFLSLFIKCGSAIFLMISGALLLGKDESYLYILKHRALRIIICMGLLSFYIFYFWQSGQTFITIFCTRLNWYLYAYLAYLLMLPILRSVCKSMNTSLARYYFLCVALVYSISGAFIVFHFSENLTSTLLLFNTTWASGCWHIVFPILGFILVNDVLVDDKFDIKKLMLSIRISSIVVIAIIMFEVKYDVTHNAGSNFEQIMQHGILFPCCWLFLELKTKESLLPTQDTFRFILKKFSGATFGVFLIETHASKFNYLFNAICDFGLSKSVYINSIVTVLILWIAYSLITMVLQKIPFIKKLL